MHPNTAHLSRGILLRSQGRTEQAVDEFRLHLLENPDDPIGHINLSLALTDLKKSDEARHHAQQAIGVAPDLGISHYALAYCDLRSGRLADALRGLDEAIRLDPHDADFFSMRASIHFQKKRWAEALADADAGLEIDPEHVGCLNLRAQALVMTKDRAAAAATLGQALEHHPENASLHANTGWAALERGQPEEAMQHFREALRLEPNLEWARRGIVEAMKARSVIYRVFLRWLFTMMRLPPRAQIGIVFGGLIAINFVAQLCDSRPALAPFLWPVLLAYLAFAVLTWTAEPMFNLLLSLNRFGRLALSQGERREAYAFGLCAVVSLALLAWIVLSGDRALLQVGAAPAILSLIAVVAVLKTPPLRPRLIILAAALVWAGLNIYVASQVVERNNQVMITKDGDAARQWIMPLFLGLQILSQYLAARDRRSH